MEVDTGGSRSITNMDTYNTIKCKSDSLTYTNSKLRTYFGDFIKPERMTEASKFANTKGPKSLGRDVWRLLLRFNWERLLNVYYVEENVRTENCLNKILPEYKEVFKSKMGTLKGFEVELTVDPYWKPKVCKARIVPYALNERTEKELERLVKDDIYEPIQYSKWAAPTVPVLADDGTVRICGDYKRTINQASLCDKYPVAKTEDLFTTLNGGRNFLS